MFKYNPNFEYSHKKNGIRFQPRRLKAYNRKILNIHSFRSKYIWEENDCSFSSYNNLNYYSRLNQSFQKVLQKYKRKDIKLSNSKADWNMDLIICSRRRYNRFYSFDKKEYDILKLNKNLLLLKSTSGVKEDGDIILFKIGIPYHSFCAILFKREKRIEIFDVSGDEFATISSRHRYPQRILDFNVYGSYTHKCYMDLLTSYFTKKYPHFYISRVCNTNLQKHPDDRFCHLWGYYYFYKRLIEGMEPWKIMNYLKRKVSSNSRFAEIKNFNNFLLYFKE